MKYISLVNGFLSHSVNLLYFAQIFEKCIFIMYLKMYKLHSDSKKKGRLTSAFQASLPNKIHKFTSVHLNEVIIILQV